MSFIHTCDFLEYICFVRRCTKPGDNLYYLAQNLFVDTVFLDKQVLGVRARVLTFTLLDRLTFILLDRQEKEFDFIYVDENYRIMSS